MSLLTNRRELTIPQKLRLIAHRPRSANVDTLQLMVGVGLRAIQGQEDCVHYLAADRFERHCQVEAASGRVRR